MNAGSRRAAWSVPLFLFLLIAAPFTAKAQSKHFPNDLPGPDTCAVAPHNMLDLAAGTIRTLTPRISYTGPAGGPRTFAPTTVCSDATVDSWVSLSSVSAGSAAGTLCAGGATIYQPRVPRCITGEDMTVRLLRAICFYASGAGAPNPFAPYTVTPTTTGGAASTCGAIANGALFSVTVIDAVAPGCGFVATKAAGADFLTFGAAGPASCGFVGVANNVTGQTVGIDMKNHYYVQVDRKSVTSGSVKLNITPIPPGLPTTCTVPWTGTATPTDDVFHEQIRACFTPHNVATRVASNPASSQGVLQNHISPVGGEAPIQDVFNQTKPVVVVMNAGSKLFEVQATVTDGAAVATETSNANFLTTGVPALSPWGVALLILVLLISSLWFFRRQAGSRTV